MRRRKFFAAVAASAGLFAVLSVILVLLLRRDGVGSASRAAPERAPRSVAGSALTASLPIAAEDPLRGAAGAANASADEDVATRRDDSAAPWVLSPLGAAPLGLHGDFAVATGPVPAIDGGGATTESLVGRVIDASSGEPVPGARLRLTAFHGPAPFDLAGCPPLAVSFAETRTSGEFVFPVPAAEDPRIEAHVQAMHAQYAPAVAVLRGREGADGLWHAVEEAPDSPCEVRIVEGQGGAGLVRFEVRLRRVLTVPVEIVAGAGGLGGHLPVRVTARRGDFDFIEREAEVSAVGALVRRGAGAVLFCDAQSTLRLPYSPHSYDLELLDPGFHLELAGGAGGGIAYGEVSLLLPSAGGVRIDAVANWVEAHELVDAAGAPIEGAEIEVALDGMTPHRVRSGRGGSILAGILPFPRGMEPLGYRNPRRGTLTVLAPEYRGRAVAVALPSAERRIVLDARPLPLLRLRTVRANGPVAGGPAPVGTDRAGLADSEPVVPQRLILSVDMTPVRLGRDGVAELRGILPPAEATLDVHASGFLPVRVLVPAAGLTPDLLDLGDVRLEDGWQKLIVLRSPAGAPFAGAALLVAPEGGHRAQRYAVGTDGRVTVRGLSRGAFTFGVEGEGVRSLTLTAEILESEIHQPLEIPLELSGDEQVVVSGRVAGLDPFTAASYVVVERYSLSEGRASVTMEPYPLAPDGSFGSVRRLAGVRAVEVAALSGGKEAAAASFLRDGPPVFQCGELPLREPPHAELEFVAETLGTVDPPLRVSITGREESEVVTRFRLEGRRLLVHNVRSGFYRLRWRGPGEAEEVFILEVRQDLGGKTTARIMRRELSEENVEILVSDSRGRPLPQARVHPAAPLRPFGLTPLRPGVKLVRVRPRQVTEIVVHADGFLDAAVRIEPDAVVPTEVSLLRPLTVFGRVRDTDGLLFEGPMTISWEPVSESAVRHGRALEVDVDSGGLHATGLPPQRSIVTFRPLRSAVSLEKELFLPESEKPYDLGDLDLSETRAIRGKVLLPDGAPASAATVALVPRDRARRLPLLPALRIDALRHHARCDVQGEFRLDSLPVELPADVVLFAHADGFVDSFEDPIDLAAEEHRLVLGEPTRLEVAVGYLGRFASPQHRFTLSYQSDREDPESARSLGEVLPESYGLGTFRDIEPGFYRVAWGLREAYAPLPGLWQDVYLPPGGAARLALNIAGDTLPGRAMLNGQPVKRGWILLTDDPGLSSTTRVGRITAGEFVVIDPPNTLRAYAAVIPESSPQPLQNTARGEALPQLVRDYRGALRQRYLEFSFEARDLTIRFTSGFLNRHPGAVLSFEHHDWDGSRFRPRLAEDSIDAQTVRLHLLTPKVHQFAVRGPRGSLIAGYSVSLRDADVTVDVR